MNAFWWIAGDCLGFRRAGYAVRCIDETLFVACALSNVLLHASCNHSGFKTTGEPYKFTSHVRCGEDRIIPYEEQIQIFTSHGFALWDVVKSCERKGSLDTHIRGEQANDLRGFCNEHPTIQRIVLTNGSTGSTMFKRHFRDWWASGQLIPSTDGYSQKAFGKIYARQQRSKQIPSTKDDRDGGTITCVSAISVSPTAARYTYKEKRDFWEQHVYQPGLDDYSHYITK